MAGAGISGKYDPALMGILQDVGNINGFLNSVFSFLMRKTDFYRFPTENNEKFGFPPGVARKMVETTFSHYETILNKNLDRLIANEQARTIANERPISRPVKELPLGAPQATGKDENGPIYLADSECYNGANREKYSWSQKIDEIDIIVKIPSEITSSKQLEVKIKKDSLSVAKKGGDYILNEQLCWPIKSKDTTWSFDPKGNKLNLSCDKCDERWWDALFTTEEKIDTQKIDCSRPMTDLSEEAQAKIAQMKYDQEQKQKGLPTSEEQQVQHILKEAWDKDGSPFRGQPFDPSILKMNSSSG